MQHEYVIFDSILNIKYFQYHFMWFKNAFGNIDLYTLLPDVGF